MKRLALLLMMLVAPLGCKKEREKVFDTTPGPDEKVKGLPRQGDLTGGGGAIQGTRKAVARSVNDSDINQLYTMITADLDEAGRPPKAAQIKQGISNARNLVALINDEIVILTDNTTPQGIWAYTKWPQRAGNHYVITTSGRSDMSPAELAKTLQAQGSMVKLEK